MTITTSLLINRSDSQNQKQRVNQDWYAKLYLPHIRPKSYQGVCLRSISSAEETLLKPAVVFWQPTIEQPSLRDEDIQLRFVSEVSFEADLVLSTLTYQYGETYDHSRRHPLAVNLCSRRGRAWVRYACGGGPGRGTGEESPRTGRGRPSQTGSGAVDSRLDLSLVLQA